MAMAQNDRNHQFSSSDGSGRDSFECHTRSMKSFREYHASDLDGGAPESDSFKKHLSHMRTFYQSHPYVFRIRVSRGERPALPESVQMPVIHLITETGVPEDLISSAEWSALPLWRVAPHSFSPN